MVSSTSGQPAASTSAAHESAYATALVRSLKHGGIKFLRYFTVDIFNNVRCKAVPINYLIRSGKVQSLQNRVCVAEVCFGGVPTYADIIIPESGMNAKGVLVIQPDLFSLRILPYNKNTAMVMGTLHDQYTGDLSPLCTRGLLNNIVQQAATEHNLAFSVGAEIEFTLFDSSNQPVDRSTFANSTTLNEQEDFISELYGFLSLQDVEVELIHAESAHGQLEVVLRYQDDPTQLADNVLLAKETIRAVATSHSLKALFLPKHSIDQAGNGLHLHLSIRNATTGEQQLSSNGGSALSPTGGAFLEGILRHLPGILGLTSPTVNSHRRIGKGRWTGSSAAWAVEDKEVPLRVCSNLETKEWEHFEYKLVDHTCNLYMALAGILVSGLDGVKSNLALRSSRDTASAATTDDALPATASEALDALDNNALLRENFGPQLIQGYLAVRRHEAERARNSRLEYEVAEAFSRA